MVGSLVIRGIIVGIVAALLAFGFAKVFGEPSVDIAIKFEASHEHGGHEHADHDHGAAPTQAADHDHDATPAAAADHDHADQVHAGQDQAAPAPGQPSDAAADAHEHEDSKDDDVEIFSRDVQSGIGLLTGLVGIGAGLGGMFGVLFAFANGRIGLGPRPTAVVLALLGLVSVYVVPALKYPANPPAVGEPDTIQLRTAVYFLMMAISIAAAVGGWMLRGRLARGLGAWNASVIAATAYLAVLAAAFFALPMINEVPADFPASTLWSFRLASLGIQTVLWMSIGVLFGYVGVKRSET